MKVMDELIHNRTMSSLNVPALMFVGKGNMVVKLVNQLSSRIWRGRMGKNVG